MKPNFTIDISDNGTSPLEALQLLSTLDPQIGHHISNGFRPPLGIYNTSLSRICDKHSKCCKKFEKYFQTSHKIKKLHKHHALLDEIIDYLELSLYATAEHVDDIFTIAKGFYDDDASFKKSKPAKQLKKEIDQFKRLISASTNAIKHNQARIRVYSLEIEYNGVPHCLHGYFIEGVHDGVVGANKIFHDTDSQIFSITSLMWEIICFVLNASRSLKRFLETIPPGTDAPAPIQSKNFTTSVIAAARLPLYSFDDKHPFSDTTITINYPPNKKNALTSNIYGSITRKWTKLENNEMNFFGESHSYAGDGITKSFSLVHPSSVKLVHWT
jgi:hypothetical protein